MANEYAPENLEEEGLLDVIDGVEDSFGKANRAIQSMNEATQTFSADIEKRQVELNRLPSDSQGIISRRALRKVLNDFSSNVDEFSDAIGRNSPTFRDSLSQGVDWLVRGVPLLSELGDADQVKTILDDIHNSIVELQGGLNFMAGEKRGS